MTDTDTAATMTLIKELWPRTDWQPVQYAEFARRMERAGIDYGQAHAALVSHSMTTKYQGVAPSEVLTVLNRITERAKDETLAKPVATEDAKARAVHAALLRLPDELAALAIEDIRRKVPAEGANHLGRGLLKLCDQYASDPLAALENSLFIWELSNHRDVAAWLNGKVETH
jgi:hypothetical protein